MTIPVVEIDLDKKCSQCGNKGACQNGLCLECSAKLIMDKSRSQIVRFLKIKVTKDGKIGIIYELRNKEQWDEYSMTSSDKAKPSFHEALQALTEDIVDMCELPNNYQDRIIVKGVSFSYGGEKEVMGATIIAQMQLRRSNVPLNLNTPHKAEEPYGEGEGDPAQLLSDSCIRRLETLMEEAEDFMKGIRAQVDMFTEAAA